MECLFRRFRPGTVVHYAGQPFAPHSMHGFDEARFTLQNNLDAATINDPL